MKYLGHIASESKQSIIQQICKQDMVVRTIKKILLGKMSEFILSFKPQLVSQTQAKAPKIQINTEGINYYDRIIAPNSPLEKVSSTSNQKE